MVAPLPVLVVEHLDVAQIKNLCRHILDPSAQQSRNMIRPSIDFGQCCLTHIGNKYGYKILKWHRLADDE